MKRWKRSMRISALSLVLFILSACGGQTAQPQQSAAQGEITSAATSTPAAITAGLSVSPDRAPIDELSLSAEQMLPLVEAPILDWDKLGITGNAIKIELDPNGNIYVLEYLYKPRENEPGKYTRVKSNIVKVSADGTRLWAIEVPLNMRSFCADANGLWAVFSEDNQLVFYNGNGQEEKHIELTDAQIGDPNSITYANDYVCVQYFVGEDFAQSKYVIVNTQTDEIRQYDVVDPRPDYSKFVTNVFPCEGPYFCILREMTGPIKPMVISKRETFVDIIDARTGEPIETIQLKDADEKNIQIMGAPGYIVYNAKDEKFYFKGGDFSSSIPKDTIYSQKRGEEYAQVVTDSSVLMTIYPTLCLIKNELLLFDSMHMKMFAFDPNYRPDGQQKKQLVVQGGAGSEVSALFSQQNPGWEIKGSETQEDNTALLLRQDSSVDVYYMDELYVDIDALVQNGYYIDLSKSQVIKDKINNMYPIFRDAVTDGKKVWGYPAFYNYQRLYVNAEYTGAVPATWAQLKELLGQDSKLLSNPIGYVQGLMVNQADVASISMNAAERRVLWQTVLENLSAFNAILPKTGSGEWNASATLSFIYPADADPNERIPLQQLKPIPALDSAASGKTLIQNNGYFVVNPYSKNVDMAMAFLETYAKSINVNEDIAPFAPPDNDNKAFFDEMMKDAYIYRIPSYSQNLRSIITSYLDGQLTQEAALEEIENIYRLAQRG